MSKITKDIIQELREKALEYVVHPSTKGLVTDFVEWLEQEVEDSRGELTYTEKALNKAAEEHQEQKCTCLISNDGEIHKSPHYPCPIHKDQEQTSPYKKVDEALTYLKNTMQETKEKYPDLFPKQEQEQRDSYIRDKDGKRTLYDGDGKPILTGEIPPTQEQECNHEWKGEKDEQGFTFMRCTKCKDYRDRGIKFVRPPTQEQKNLDDDDFVITYLGEGKWLYGLTHIGMIKLKQATRRFNAIANN